MDSDKKFKDIISSVIASYRISDEEFCLNHFPDKYKVIEIIETTRKLLFPEYFGKHVADLTNLELYVGNLLSSIEVLLQEQICRALSRRGNANASCANTDRADGCAGVRSDSGCPQSLDNLKINKSSASELSKLAGKLSRVFIGKIPQMREYLLTDIQAAFEGDPAAFDKHEIIFAYPGLLAVSIYRMAHELHLLSVPYIPRMMTEYAHSLTGIDIHPGAAIGKHFFIDHGTGVVIGETVKIGNYVKIYQGVTLGALSTRGGQHLKGKQRHPVIEDEVTIYSSTSVLGGETVIGKGSVIGGGAFITESVPANSRITAKQNTDSKNK